MQHSKEQKKKSQLNKYIIVRTVMELPVARNMQSTYIRAQLIVLLLFVHDSVGTACDVNWKSMRLLCIQV